MAVETSAALQKSLVFSQAQSSVSAELQQICPQANLTVVDPAQTAWLLPSQTSDPVDWHRAIAWLRPTDTCHGVDDPQLLLIHVTAFNQLPSVPL